MDISRPPPSPSAPPASFSPRRPIPPPSLPASHPRLRCSASLLPCAAALLSPPASTQTRAASKREGLKERICHSYLWLECFQPCVGRPEGDRTNRCTPLPPSHLPASLPFDLPILLHSSPSLYFPSSAAAHRHHPCIASTSLVFRLSPASHRRGPCATPRRYPPHYSAVCGRWSFSVELNEVLTPELGKDGYSGVKVRVTPMRTGIINRATRTQNVLGEKGRRIRELTSVVHKRFKFPENSVVLVNNRGLCAIAQEESLRNLSLGHCVT